MCGIYGLRTSDVKYYKLLKKLCSLSSRRGSQASGIVLYIKSKKKFKIFKANFKAIKLLKEVASEIHEEYKLSGEVTVLGHTRMATNGSPHLTENNQPVTRNNSFLIHNGIIVNDNSIISKHNLSSLASNLDSEIILALLERELRCQIGINEVYNKVFSGLEGVINICHFDFKTKNLIIASNNGSLFYNQNNESEFIFSSEKNILKETIKINKSERIISQLNFNAKIKLGKYNCNDVSISNRVLNSHDFIGQNNKSESIPKEFIEFVNNKRSKVKSLKRCKKCLLPSSFPYIKFDQEGICNYCKNFKKNKVKGLDELKKILFSNNKAKVLVGLSGGRDSSYLLHICKKVLNVEVVAFSYDWGLLTDLARRNQSRMCSKLNVEHIIVSANIMKKRNDVKKNVSAWLEKPEISMVPLFMSGDKHYFYYANKVAKETNCNFILFGENLLETTYFKYGFSGVSPNFSHKTKSYTINIFDKLKMMGNYFVSFLKNPRYINSSLFDTFFGFFAFYFDKKTYINLYEYLDWNEKEVNETLKLYNWEIDKEASSTWRIGDGTVAFYNYIYLILAGFTENETFRSNQIRSHILSRDEGLRLVEKENKIRWNSIQWYCNTIGIDWKKAIKKINTSSSLYE